MKVCVLVGKKTVNAKRIYGTVIVIFLAYAWPRYIVNRMDSFIRLI